MAESLNSPADSSTSFFRGHWEGWKGYWGEKFAFLDDYGRFVKREKPIPSWSDSDVEEFIASDPVNGPTLKTAREAVKIAATGSIIGAISTAGISWKYSRSPHAFVIVVGLIPCGLLNLPASPVLFHQLFLGFDALLLHLAWKAMAV